MPLEIQIKVVRVSGSLRMTIPKEVVHVLGIKAGDTMAVSLDDSRMVARKA